MNNLHLHHPWAPEIWHDLGAAKNILDCDRFLMNPISFRNFLSFGNLRFWIEK